MKKTKGLLIAFTLLAGSLFTAIPAEARDGYRGRGDRDGRYESRYDDRRNDDRYDDRRRGHHRRDDQHRRYDTPRYRGGYWLATPPPPRRYCPEPERFWVQGHYDRWGYWIPGHWIVR